MNRNELDDQLLDQVLKYIASEEMEKLASQYPSSEELESQVSFRPKFEKQMLKFINKIKRQDKIHRFKIYALRVGVSFIVFLVISTAAILSVDALRVPFLNLLTISGKESTTIRINDLEVDYNLFSDKIDGLALPNFIPESYSIKTLDRLGDYYIIEFANIDNGKIRLETLLDGSTFGVDNENTLKESLVINNEPAQYFQKDETNVLIFIYNKQAFMIEASIHKDELIDIAESFVIRN